CQGRHLGQDRPHPRRDRGEIPQGLEQQSLGEGERRGQSAEEVGEANGREESCGENKGKVQPRMSMPAFVAPQLARLLEAPPSGPGWVHEVKFDGYRMQMRVERRKAHLRTRKALDWTERFPEIADDGAALPDCIIDGEICALNPKGVSDFGLLQAALSDHKT